MDKALLEIDKKALDAVKVEDRDLVRDVIKISQVLNLGSSWSVQVISRGYEIIIWLNNTHDDVNVTLEDMDLLYQVSRVRVHSVGIKYLKETSKCCLRIIIFSHSEPLMLQEQDIVRIQKKKRWLL